MLKMPETESLPRVYLVGGDMTWNGEITETFDGRYVVWSSGDHVKALDEMSSVPPDAVILEENMPPKGASYFLGLRRGIERLKNVPFIITGERGAKRIQAVFLEGDTYLSWPCTDQELLSEVAKAINTTVERSWEKLPEIQRKPLKMTVETYHNISEAVAKGEPVDYAEAAESCQALVEAVQSNQHNALLDLVQAHHSYTYVHSMRVATLLTLFGNDIGMSEDEVLTLTTGGFCTISVNCWCPSKSSKNRENSTKTNGCRSRSTSSTPWTFCPKTKTWPRESASLPNSTMKNSTVPVIQRDCATVRSTPSPAWRRSPISSAP